MIVFVVFIFVVVVFVVVLIVVVIIIIIIIIIITVFNLFSTFLTQGLRIGSATAAALPCCSPSSMPTSPTSRLRSALSASNWMDALTKVTSTSTTLDATELRALSVS
jgi:hypothetical protein